MPPSRGRAHHHRSGQSNVKKAHNKKKGAGPNQPQHAHLKTTGSATKNTNSGTSSTTTQQGVAAPPKLVAFVALHDSANPFLLKQKCLQRLGCANYPDYLPATPVTVNLPPWAHTTSGGAKSSQRMTLLDVPTRDKFQVLDAAKVADVLVLCTGPQGSLESRPFDDLGYETLSCLKSQGIPLVVGAIQGLDDGEGNYKSLVEQFFAAEAIESQSCDTKIEVQASRTATSSSSSGSTASSCPLEPQQTASAALLKQVQSLSKKQKAAISKLTQRFFESEFPNGEKFFEVGSESETTTFLRHLANLNLVTSAAGGAGAREVGFRKDRGYLLVEKAEVHIGDDSAMSGAAVFRPPGGAGEDADAMMDDSAIPDAAPGSVPNIGASSLARQRDADSDSDFSFSDLNEELFRNAEECPTKSSFEFEERAQEDLDFPDEVDTPLPPAEAKVRFQKYRGLRSLKTSPWDRYEDLPLEYSRIWEFDGFKSCCNAAKQVFLEDATAAARTLAGLDAGRDEDDSMQQHGSNKNLHRNKEPQLFVAVTIGNVSGAQLQKLQNLNKITLQAQTQPPSDLGKNTLVPGATTSASATTPLTVQGPVILSTLFPHEHQVSVMHFQIHRATAGTDSLTPGKTLDRSIKSKTELEFHCGFRRFLARPIFSQLPKKSCAEKDKHLYLRYCHGGSSCVASVYAPILFSPCTLLMFEKEAGEIDRVCSNAGGGVVEGSSPTASAESIAGGGNAMDVEMDEQEHVDEHQGPAVGANKQLMKNSSSVAAWTEAGRKSMLAWGEVIDANPKKVIVKRCVLTGYPFRVHKNKAVVRHMFFKPDDIRWFRPVELRTKQGLRGNIKESLGTHGYMKCVFGDRIKQNDTICMDLWKRQYKRCKGKGKNKSSSTSSMAAAAVAKTSKNNVAVLKQQVGKPNASNKASKTKKANPAEEKDQDHESKSNSKEQSLSYFPSAPKSHKMIQEQQAEQQDHDYRGTRATTSGCGVEIQIMKTDGDGVLGQEDQQLSTGFGLTSTAAGGFFSTTASTSMVCGRGGGSAEGVEHNMASLKTLHLQKKSSIGGGNTNVVLFGEAVVLAGPGGGGDGHDKQDDVEGKKNNSKSVKLQVQVDNDLELDELAAPKIVEPAQPAAAKMKRMARKMVHDLKSQADALGVEDHEDDHASTFVVVEKNAHLSAATGGGAPGEEPPTKKRRGNYSKPAMKKVSKSKGKERGGAAALDVVEVKGRKRSASANVGVSSDFAVHVEEKNVESNFYYVRCEHSVTCGGIVKVAKDDPKLLKLKTELVNPSCVMLSATTASAATSSSTAKELQQDAAEEQNEGAVVPPAAGMPKAGDISADNWRMRMEGLVCKSSMGVHDLPRSTASRREDVACAEACEADNACQAYLYDYAAGTCHLGDVRDSDPCAASVFANYETLQEALEQTQNLSGYDANVRGMRIRAPHYFTIKSFTPERFCSKAMLSFSVHARPLDYLGSWEQEDETRTAGVLDESGRTRRNNNKEVAPEIKKNSTYWKQVYGQAIWRNEMVESAKRRRGWGWFLERSYDNAETWGGATNVRVAQDHRANADSPLGNETMRSEDGSVKMLRAP
eukprot:g7670.t1